MRFVNPLILIAAVSIASCSSQNPGHQDQNYSEPRVLPVTDVLVKDTNLYREYVADIQAVQNVELRARVQGFLEKIYVDEGQVVRKGEVLFKINDEEYRAELAKANANLESAIAEAKASSLATGILASVAAPIFNKKRIRAQFSRSVAARAEAYYMYQKTIINGYGEVVNNMRSIENLREIYRLKEQEVNVLQKAVSTSNVLFTSGYATYLEVITAQKSVLKAELELAHVKKGIFHSVIGLYRALGGGGNVR